MGHRVFLTLLSTALIAVFTVTHAVSATDGNKAEGAKVFSRYCTGCHGPGGNGSGMAPSLTAVKDRQMVIQTVTNGRGQMPSFANQLSADQIQAVADYVTAKIAGVSLTGGDLSRGGVLYRVN